MIHVHLAQTAYDPRCDPHTIVIHERGDSVEDALERWPLGTDVGVSIDGNRLEFYVCQIEHRP